jgi:methylated-DNA-[protein]-cysteine S-methyltransferase
MSGRPGIRIVESPLGSLTLVARNEGLSHLLFPVQEGAPPPGESGDRAVAILDETERQLGEYFAGVRRGFELPLRPAGTEFQLSVWWALAEISYGTTLSYGELAQHIGRPKAVRAVGAANGANPLPIVLPCHRVIGADGSLTGFGGGLPAKIALLELEGVILA